MKKAGVIGILGLCFSSLFAPDILARHRTFIPPENCVNLSLFVFHPLSVGYKRLVSRNLYLTGNMDYDGSDKDLLFQGGAAYLVPRKILFFRLYGGGGVEFSRNRGYMYPYVSVGTMFWILYTEVVHPLREGREPGFRLGFNITF